MNSILKNGNIMLLENYNFKKKNNQTISLILYWLFSFTLQLQQVFNINVIKGLRLPLRKSGNMKFNG